MFVSLPPDEHLGWSNLVPGNVVGNDRVAWSVPRPHPALAAPAVAVALLAAACGGDDGASADPATQAAADAADANAGELASSDDPTMIEVLDVTTGDATTLADAVDGDRPVLVWFWAPH